MAEMELTLTDAQIQALLCQDGGLARVVEALLNRVLESEMTEHVGAAPHERSSTRRGHRNGYYTRDLTLRVGRIELAVPRDRDGTGRSERSCSSATSGASGRWCFADEYADEIVVILSEEFAKYPHRLYIVPTILNICNRYYTIVDLDLRTAS